MNMTENELAAEIKARSVGGFYFFYGDEDYMKNHRAAEMKKCVTGDYPDFASFNSIDLNFGDGEMDLSALSDALSTPPLLSPMKIVTLSLASLDSFKEKERSALFELPKLVFRNIGKTFYDNFSAFEAGLDISLDMPIFLLPFTRNIVFQRIKPHTLFSATTLSASLPTPPSVTPGATRDAPATSCCP